MAITLATIKKKARAHDLDWEHMAEAARLRLPGLKATFEQLTQELGWTFEAYQNENGSWTPPHAASAYICGLYAEEGTDVLERYKYDEKHRYSIMRMVEHLHTDLDTDFFFEMYKDLFNNPASNYDLAFQLCNVLNFRYSFKNPAPISSEQKNIARTFLIKLHDIVKNEIHRVWVLAALRGVADENTIDFIAATKPFEEEVHKDLQKSIIREIRKRLKAEGILTAKPAPKKTIKKRPTKREKPAISSLAKIKVHKIDDASWHYEGDFPQDLPIEAAATHIGMFLCWLLQNDFASDDLQSTSWSAIENVKNQAMSGAEFLMQELNGKLVSSDLNQEGASFAQAYYEGRDGAGQFWCDYYETFQVVSDTLYEVEDSFENYARLAPHIDHAYQTWTKNGRPDFIVPKNHGKTG